MDYLIAFLVEGPCAIGQILIDVAKMQPAHMLVLVVAAVLSGLGFRSSSTSPAPEVGAGSGPTP